MVGALPGVVPARAVVADGEVGVEPVLVPADDEAGAEGHGATSTSLTTLTHKEREERGGGGGRPREQDLAQMTWV